MGFAPEGGCAPRWPLPGFCGCAPLLIGVAPSGCDPLAVTVVPPTMILSKAKSQPVRVETHDLRITRTPQPNDVEHEIVSALWRCLSATFVRRGRLTARAALLRAFVTQSAAVVLAQSPVRHTAAASGMAAAVLSARPTQSARR